MCGRASVITPEALLEERFNAAFAKGVHLEENVNISAGNRIPVITSRHPHHIQMFSLGFTPYWAHKQTYMINARSEGSLNPENDPLYDGNKGIFSKPMFRHAIRSQRCLVLVDAFIEGPKNEKLNKPYLIYPNRDRGPFALAGIHDTWKHPLTGALHHTVAIITTAANRLTQRIGHHRAPVVLTREQEEQWLDADLDQASLSKIMRPFDAKGFNAYPISPKIKNPEANGLELLKPVGDKIFKDYDRCLYERLKYAEEDEYVIREERLVEGDQFVLF
ncbi:SOS response-associated peptidase [Nonlabens xiamenensis]|uniref:SOS response-associated peptidase n=1 Tax=Nonlabens xiamenensis TaxID=2341043 RepID=UPI000F6111BB|nr:SOS response-associated peptidase [Nonlabens xiamenensis]